MSLLEHLEELRGRIIVVAITIVLAGIVGFFLSEPIIAILRAALPEGKQTLIQISVGESLAVRLRVALYVGVAFSVPVILFEIWVLQEVDVPARIEKDGAGGHRLSGERSGATHEHPQPGGQVGADDVLGETVGRSEDPAGGNERTGALEADAFRAAHR